MSRQDRQGTRTPAGLEQKYNFGRVFSDQKKENARQDSEMNRQNFSTREFISYATATIVRLSTELTAVRESLQTANDQINGKLKETEETLSKHGIKLADAEMELSQQGKKLLSSEEAVENLEQNVTGILERLSKAEEQVSKFDERVSSAESEIATLKLKVVALENGLQT